MKTHLCAASTGAASNQPLEKAALASATADSTAVGAIEAARVQTGNRADTSFKNEDDFNEEKLVKTFDQEGTPAVISGRASLSDITISDEETVSFNFRF